MEVEILQASDEQVVFELNNVDVSFANALRRIMIAEVPTMAIEYVNIEANDSVIHDEVLAHRLGLLPIKADPEKFEACTSRADLDVGKNAIELILDFTAGKKSVKEDGSVHVLTKHFRVVDPSTKQTTTTDDDEEDEHEEVGFVHPDIVITKIRPGQSIKLRCFATKGIGREHTKWSPVCTASYRSTPNVTINKSIKGDDAKALKSLCPKSVFDIEDGALIVADNKACSVCRECVRDARGKEKITLGRIKDSFCFSVESTGVMPATEIVRRSVNVLKEKCINVRDNLEL